jgi:hypothetical protein
MIICSPPRSPRSVQCPVEPWRGSRQRVALFSRGGLIFLLDTRCQSLVEKYNRNSCNVALCSAHAQRNAFCKETRDKIIYLNIFAFLGRIPVLDTHTQCFILLVECQLKIQLKMLTISAYSHDNHLHTFHWYTSTDYCPWVIFWHGDAAKYASYFGRTRCENNSNNNYCNTNINNDNNNSNQSKIIVK